LPKIPAYEFHIQQSLEAKFYLPEVARPDFGLEVVLSEDAGRGG
jgi:hypothetical protein